jgi:diaminopimelate epimerase
VTVRLAKLHATGNDFLVTIATGSGPEIDARTAAALCDRQRGVGADGLIVVGLGTDAADCSMTLRNADGEIAEMSGNGIRCLGWVAAAAGLARGDELVVATAAGTKVVHLDRDPSGRVCGAEVDMGPVTFDPAQIPIAAESPFDVDVEYHGAAYSGDAAGMGNPHLVLFVDDPAAVRVESLGPRFERDSRFPRGANVEFVCVEARDRLHMRVWERGVGETLSCGTGACAAAAVARRRELVDDAVTVVVTGGRLRVVLSDDGVRLGGPVVHVFDLDVDLDAVRASAA